MNEKNTFDPTRWINPSFDNEVEKVRAVCDELLQQGANIAESENDYYRLIEAMVDLGEAGKEMCRQLCQQSTKFEQRDFEYKWKWATGNQKRSIHIGTFYDMARQHGINLSAISRQFPSADFTSKPQNPHGYAASSMNQGKSVSGNSQLISYQNNNYNYTASKSASGIGADSGEEIEELRFSGAVHFFRGCPMHRTAEYLVQTIHIS